MSAYSQMLRRKTGEFVNDAKGRLFVTENHGVGGSIPPLGTMTFIVVSQSDNVPQLGNGAGRRVGSIVAGSAALHAEFL